MSFSNVFAQDPPIVILGIQKRPDGSPKDTVVSIRETGEFVVNLCDLTIAQAMVDCGSVFPHGVDESRRPACRSPPPYRSVLAACSSPPARWSAGCTSRSSSRAARSCSGQVVEITFVTTASTRLAVVSGPMSTSRSHGCTPTTISSPTGSSC